MKRIITCLIFIFLISAGVSMTFMQEENTASAATATESPAEVIIYPTGYSAEERQWQGIPSVEITAGGRIWVSYFTGGEKEPSTENCVAFAYSDDDGETFVDQFFIVKHLSADVRTYDPCVWKDPLNRMWFTWCQARGNYGDLKNWAIVLDNPDGTAEQMQAELSAKQPRLLGDGVKLNKMTVLKNGDWLFFAASSTPSAITVWSSTDNGETWEVRSLVGGNGYRVTEPAAVQLDNGDIYLLTRIEKISGVLTGGGIGRSFSKDNGYTWSEYEADLDFPLRGPSSRFSFQKLQSGNLLFVNNESETGRTKLTAYLSVNDGESWDYKCLLDERTEVSYPSTSQGKDGNIYVVYDKGRYIEKEIRLTKFIEQDIIDGNILSENAKIRIAVSVLGNQKDIEEVVTELPKELSVNYGTLLSEARKNLPTTVKVKDKDGNEYTLSGKWSSENYNAEKSGTYVLKFSATTDMLIYNLFDAHNILQTKLIIKEKSGCSSGIIGGEIGVGLSLSALGICLIKKRKGEGEK